MLLLFLYVRIVAIFMITLYLNIVEHKVMQDTVI